MSDMRGTRIWKFGDDIDTDAIIPGRFLTIYDPKELASHAFEGTRDEFPKEAKQGDVIVGGRNFGCGSSREHAPIALKGAGIEMVVAKSFARIFYRNCINTGLLPVVCPEADKISEDDTITPRLDEGYIEVSGKKFATEPVPEFLSKIIEAGGLVEYAKGIDEVETCIK
ncbi:3-isopropylmalate dehydratase, small subunit [Methanolacinia petrolearia DSM 11571]|uniref:3-isopropylmalate dehydratase small subunit n=1 Tax=Methanolacinia petrolearia (strain DSM 11571 / OCM 486 / SEBR 4847) TaxID=679926 RepID=E1RKI8_METP4|nr:3-isopropylmalate dehydratase small subunit [Methanolacinia petrolearia]ADN35841.1 3-isopropylmalate dehydratase, small subunit [Methanolacinia petrolearia DSM 11571]